MARAERYRDQYGESWVGRWRAPDGTMMRTGEHDSKKDALDEALEREVGASDQNAE